MYKLLHGGPRTVLQAEESYIGERVLFICTWCAVLCTVKAKIKIILLLLLLAFRLNLGSNLTSEYLKLLTEFDMQFL